MANVFGVIGNTLRTASGLTFDIANPTPEMVRIEDIAHALSRICRFGGHVEVEWYSVAEHCLLCAELAHRDKLPPEAKLAVLLHDAAEAYIGDVIKPLKVMLPEYDAIEAGVEAAVAAALEVDFIGHAETIKRYDHAMLVNEKNLLIRDSHTFCFDGEKQFPNRLQRHEFKCLPPRGAQSCFLFYHQVLMKELGRTAQAT